MFFNFLKSKPTLKELIPDGFVDIHSHILPGIDDGAKDVKESMKIISKMKNMGFSKIIGTPHTYPGLYDNTNDSIKKAYEKVKISELGNIEIGFASEYMIEKSLIEKAKNKSLLCIKDNYVLVEMSYISEPLGLFDIIYEIKVNGYIPVLAHPERYMFIKNLKEYSKLKKFGCLFQANLLSTTNYYGKYASNMLDKLLKEKLIDYVGSDIHSIKHINAFDGRLTINNIGELKKCIKRNENLE
tara:strand:+ start:170 stop:895 length:726 start_codon:yes stop_codon:yes gene_type:complete